MVFLIRKSCSLFHLNLASYPMVQYVLTSDNMDCNERGFYAKRTASSAKNNKHNLSSSNVTIPSISVLICWMISFRENKHCKLFDGSPCFTPNFELMKSELMPLYRIHALVEQYIDLIAMVTLELTVSFIIFCQRKHRSILSNIFSQPRNAT